MSELRIAALPAEEAGRLQAGHTDANGEAPERHASDGDGVPWRIGRR